MRNNDSTGRGARSKKKKINALCFNVSFRLWGCVVKNFCFSNSLEPLKAFKCERKNALVDHIELKV